MKADPGRRKKKEVQEWISLRHIHNTRQNFVLRLSAASAAAVFPAALIPERHRRQVEAKQVAGVAAADRGFRAARRTRPRLHAA
ncbi:hypothetical protein E2C01_085603 [Portunus trituberculatus]|uniref:Uncharacterized protein n=1 Tax=Portunus trituberculatus TaxID=210409 RepID=A0A5B7JCD8_PORTR|nr:hypothetical protein [Portunus trituberculatus]